nr:reverse transcriptase domain-containing protein [Tanacetum cinerariifolium]
MMMYLKNVAGFKLDYFKGMSYDDIRPIFEAKFNSNITFLLKTKEQIEEEKNRALQTINETPAQKAAKRRKLNEEVEDLKRNLEIVPDEYDDVYTEATPLPLPPHNPLGRCRHGGRLWVANRPPQPTEKLWGYPPPNHHGGGGRMTVHHNSRTLWCRAVMTQPPRVSHGEILSDYDCEIRYHPGKANVVADALRRKERVKTLRVRALVMTIGLNLPKQILEAQTEALKPENLTAKDVGGLLR